MGTYATFVFALGIVFTANPNRRRYSKRAIRNVIFGLILLCVMFGALSCGGGNSGSSSGSGPTPINGNITITGTGGGITRTAPINVTVH
jgi:predicted PurR-regulated permease PerM